MKTNTILIIILILFEIAGFSIFIANHKKYSENIKQAITKKPEKKAISTNLYVKNFQRFLNEELYYDGKHLIKVDGIFGPKTYNAFKYVCNAN